MLKRRLHLYFVNSLMMILLLSSCDLLKPAVTGELVPIDLKQEYNVYAGDSCVVSWNIPNATKVYINSNDYKNTDAIKIFPKDTTVITLDAINNENRKLFPIKINVIERNLPIQTGKENLKNNIDQISLDFSEYMSGIKPANIKEPISNIKIMSFDLDGNTLKVNFLPLDKFGNFADGMNFNESELAAQFIDESIQIPLKVNSIKKYHTNQNYHLYYLIENSAVVQSRENMIGQLRNSLLYYDQNDKVSLFLNNNELQELIANANPEYASMSINVSDFEPKKLNSYANGLFSVIQKIKDNSAKYPNEIPIIVTINYSGDNSSITYSLTDISEIARIASIPIYSIGIGLDTKTYQLQPLSNSTGARSYMMVSLEDNSLTKALNEIYFSNKFGYQAEFSLLSSLQNIQNIPLQVSYHNGEKLIEDKIGFYTKEPNIYTPFQILALFNLSNTQVQSEYLPKIGELADLLIDNPDMQIELLGYSNYEYLTEDEDIELAGNRAIEIKNQLVNFGVKPDQIITKSKGNSNPIYYLPKSEWQIAVNRRVEMKWLDPAYEPFELSAQIAESESEAMKYVNEWEKAGYRAYYDRLINKDQDPKYKVKIWGFSTQREAENVQKVLSFKYQNINFVLE